jgi:tungstate transport system ATP-binding protein
MKTEILYRIRGLSFGWPATDQGSAPVLDIPSLDIMVGSCLAVTGPNGSGKTTLLKLLDGLLAAPDPRSISYQGPAGSSRGPREPRPSTYLHQHPYLIAGTVYTNVALACRAARLPTSQSRQRVEQALARVGLAGFARRSRRALSGGEIQRVALARVLAAATPVLLLDEPCASVDSASLILIRQILRDLKAEGFTIIFTSHDPELVQSLADRVIELQAGRIVKDSQIPGEHA